MPGEGVARLIRRHLQRRRVAGSAGGDQHVVNRLGEIFKERAQGVVVPGVEGRGVLGSHLACSMLQPLGIAARQNDLGSLGPRPAGSLEADAGAAADDDDGLAGKVLDHVHLPGRRSVISWSTQPFPSGSLNSA